MRYGYIHRHRAHYPIRLMCRLLKVSPSGYYAWRTRPESRRVRVDRELTRAIRQAHAESDGTYGSPRVHAELKARGWQCGRARVARIMRNAGLKGCPKRRFKVTRKRGVVKARNLLEQDFSFRQSLAEKVILLVQRCRSSPGEPVLSSDQGANQTQQYNASEQGRSTSFADPDFSVAQGIV